LRAFSSLTDLIGQSFVSAGIFFVLGRAPTRDVHAKCPFISIIFVGVGLVPTREPKPQQSSPSTPAHSSETEPFRVDEWGFKPPSSRRSPSRKSQLHIVSELQVMAY
jgi:hypothetical protein